MNIKIILIRVFQAFVRPVKNRIPINIFRSFIRLPVIFDLVSLVMQLIDYRNLRKLNKMNLSDIDQFERAKKHNVNIVLTKFITTTRRFELLYQLLCIHASTKVQDMELLIIGPRNIVELLNAWTYGFKWKNINGIDLFSTNRKIQVMNMEDLKYENNTFDCITMANTLVYADDIKKALSEVFRVLKPNGLVVFGQTFNPSDVESYPESTRNGKYVHEIIQEYGMEVFYHLAYEKQNIAGNKQTHHIFGCKKKDPEHKPYDPFFL